MSKSKCYFCKRELRSGEWQLQQNEDGKVIKVCFNRKECAKKCVAQGKGLLSFGLHKGVE